jgi:prepilin peptidase CpaA
LSYLPPVLQAILGALVIAAGAYDLTYRRVPNWLVLIGLSLGISLNTFLYGIPGLLLALEGMGLALLIYFPLFAIRAMGAGDAKLMAAIGSIVGPWNWLGIFILTGILGGVVGLIALAVRSRLKRAMRNVWLILTGLAQRTAPYQLSPELDVRASAGFRLPHAAVITFGTLSFLWLAAVYAPR